MVHERLVYVVGDVDFLLAPRPGLKLESASLPVKFKKIEMTFLQFEELHSSYRSNGKYLMSTRQ